MTNSRGPMPTDYGEEQPTTTADDLDSLADQLQTLGAFDAARICWHAAELLRWQTGQEQP